MYACSNRTVTRISVVRRVRTVAAIALATLVWWGLHPPGEASATTTTFDQPGTYSYTVPNSVNQYVIQAFGAQGGWFANEVAGGLGGEAVTSEIGGYGRLLQINVGGQGGAGSGGFNGGGTSGLYSGTGGGGASDVRRGAFQLADRVIVAGGGGGAGPQCQGGAGGGQSGSGGCDSGGGTQTDGGYCSGPECGAGILGGGGQGGYVWNPFNPGFPVGGQGGGGGYYGGGGGVHSGGGGSGYTPDGTGMTAGVESGNGRVKISWASIDSAQVEAPTVTIGQSISIAATLGGFYDPQGQVTASLYPGQACVTGYQPIFQGQPMTGSGTDFESSEFTPTAVGRYRWVISYTGDERYDDASTKCDDQGTFVTVQPHTPTGLNVSPESPANNNFPRVAGTADTDSMVSVFKNAECSGIPVATASPQQFNLAGVPVHVDDDTTTTFYATSVTNETESPCSAASFPYIEDSTAPTVNITGTPAALTNADDATFEYSSSESDSTFECRLDTQDFTTCPDDGIAYADLLDGSHTFVVRATDQAGNVSTEQTFTWTIDTAPPVVTLGTKPPTFSNSVSASFIWSSTRQGSSFECSLDSAAFSSCPADGIDYTGLTASAHTFRVRATSPAGNLGPVLVYAWTIDTTLPQPTILSQPQASSTVSSATFTYASSESGSTFECELDGSGFSPCPVDGITYTGLADGPHSFGVRPIDLAGNVGSAATYSWSISTAVRPPAPPLSARIGNVKVNGPKKVKLGRRASYRVRITNAGDTAATGVRVKLKAGSTSAAKRVGKVAAKATRTVTIKVTPKKTGRTKLRFRVSSKNAGSRTVRLSLMVRR